ncbi:DUF1697 domain-containing protein [Bauldia sp.]|uniref:DUF1697 domain-containing protein n=1 Tax=Bauldia sp. TaxID=2575872 RepID=UPI003BAC8899
MKTWIALIRGIGPTTHRVMTMQQLRDACVGAGFDEVRTILATGNLLFATKVGLPAIRKRVAAIISDHGLTNPVFYRRPAELKAIVAKDPMPDAASERPNHLLVMFLDKEPAPQSIDALSAYDGPEQILVSDREVYIDYVDGVGTSKLTPTAAGAAARTVRNCAELEHGGQARCSCWSGCEGLADSLWPSMLLPCSTRSTSSTVT